MSAVSEYIVDEVGQGSCAKSGRHIHGKGGRARSLIATSLLSATCLIGMLAFSTAASAAPVNSGEPTISYTMSDENPNATGLQTLIPAVDADGNAITGPQVGFVLVANDGNWTVDNPGDSITYTYQWWTSTTANASTAGTPIAKSGKALDFAPTTAQIGDYIGVTVTATDTTTGTSSSAMAETATPGVGLNPAQTSTYSTAMNQPESDGGLAPYDTFAYLTAYGYPDNTPPSAGIAFPATSTTTFPSNSTGTGIHTSASGTGTYSDPVTTADYTGMLRPARRSTSPATRSTTSSKTPALSAGATSPDQARTATARSASGRTAAPGWSISTAGSAGTARTSLTSSPARTR